MYMRRLSISRPSDITILLVFVLLSGGRVNSYHLKVRHGGSILASLNPSRSYVST